MIHLYGLIRELGILIENKAPLTEIRKKCEDIQAACLQLAREHGRGSDIALKLVSIFDTARTLQEGNFAAAKGGYYPQSKKLWEGMEGNIKRIAEILRIELTEFES